MIKYNDVSSFYSPNEHDEHSLRITVISGENSQNSQMWILGDFNVPEMNWSNQSPSDTCIFKELYDTFTENIINHNLKQMVIIPTRNNNILDLFPTMSSSWNQNVTRLRHNRLRYTCSISRNQAKTPDRPNLTKRLIGVTLRKTWLSSLMCSQHIYINTKTMFKAEVNRLSTRHIQTRQVKGRADLPWVTCTRNSQTNKKKRQTVH